MPKKKISQNPASNTGGAEPVLSSQLLPVLTGTGSNQLGN